MPDTPHDEREMAATIREVMRGSDIFSLVY